MMLKTGGGNRDRASWVFCRWGGPLLSHYSNHVADNLEQHMIGGLARWGSNVLAPSNSHPDLDGTATRSEHLTPHIQPNLLWTENTNPANHKSCRRTKSENEGNASSVQLCPSLAWQTAPVKYLFLMSVRLWPSVLVRLGVYGTSGLLAPKPSGGLVARESLRSSWRHVARRWEVRGRGGWGEVRRR